MGVLFIFQVSLAVAEHFAGITGLFFGIPILLYVLSLITNKSGELIQHASFKKILYYL
jgi:predicted PurR-regulated permease PerM